MVNKSIASLNANITNYSDYSDETNALEELISLENITLQRFNFSTKVAYIVKEYFA
jgi:hypothetical protein